MAQRDDITVDFSLSPRLITIAAPSTEITIQDLHDTLREIEAEVGNMIYPILVSTAGKEELGGGVEVGLTSTLQNAQIQFEARYIRTSAGNCSSFGAAGSLFFEDGDATFISDGVLRGATITNFDDESFATVVDIISETRLRIDPFADGYTNECQIGDRYKIHNEIQCEVTGGNLVAVDAVGSSIDSISPTAFVQIVRTSSASATNQNLLDIEYSSFNGGVNVDIDNITGLAGTGTTFPSGTPRQPVNNFEDALEIAAVRGFDVIFIKGNATINSGLIYDNFTFIGQSIRGSAINISSDASVFRCEFQDMSITGVLDGYSSLRECEILNLEFFDGSIIHSGIAGTVILGGGRQAEFIDCHSNVAGGDPGQAATINCGGSGQSLIVRNYHGGIKITNRNGTDPVSIDMSSGQVTIDETVTNGTVTIRGIGKLTDNSTGNAIIDASHYIQGIQIQRIAYDRQIHIDQLFGSPGTVVGINGVPSNPVNNLDDALTLEAELGLNAINVRNNAVLDQNIIGQEIMSTGRALLDVDGYSIDACFITDIGVTGTMLEVLPGEAGGITVTDCLLVDLYNFRGSGNNCILFGELQFSSTNNSFLRNLSVDETNPLVSNLTNNNPTLNVNGGKVVIQGLDGYVTVTNMSTPDSSLIITTNGGFINIDSSCVDGEIIIRGFGTIINQGSSSLNIGDFISAVELDNISSDVFKRLFPFIA